MLLNMVMFKVTFCDLKNKDRNMADNIEPPPCLCGIYENLRNASRSGSQPHA